MTIVTVATVVVVVDIEGTIRLHLGEGVTQEVRVLTGEGEARVHTGKGGPAPATRTIGSIEEHIPRPSESACLWP